MNTSTNNTKNINNMVFNNINKKNTYNDNNHYQLDYNKS